MVSTKLLTIYLFVLLFFNFFLGQFEIAKDTFSSDMESSKGFIVTKLKTDANNYWNEVLGKDSWLNKLISFPVDIIFIFLFIIEGIIYIVGLIVNGISMFPTINLLLITPLGLILLYEYVIPLIRGN